MFRSYTRLLQLLIGLSLMASSIVYAQDKTVITVNGRPVIVTQVPAPKEVTNVPEGYVSCFMIPAGWNYNNVWVAEHKVCQYTPNDGGEVLGVAWVEGYWACTKHTVDAEPTKANCTNWEWKSGRWVKTLEVY